jgi:hypothetical protein
MLSSDSSLGIVRDVVAMKLGIHPALLKLRSRLSTENVKTRTFIGTTEELKLLVEGIRPFYVQQRTKTGKYAKRNLKQVSVIFDDANTAPNAADAAKGKVSLLLQSHYTFSNLYSGEGNTCKSSLGKPEACRDLRQVK